MRILRPVDKKMKEERERELDKYLVMKSVSYIKVAGYLIITEGRRLDAKEVARIG